MGLYIKEKMKDYPITKSIKFPTSTVREIENLIDSRQYPDFSTAIKHFVKIGMIMKKSKRICQKCGRVKILIPVINPFKKICVLCEYDEIQKNQSK